MRPALIFTIYRKELTETLRDWRTLLMMVGLPVLLYPLLTLGFSEVQQSQSHALEARTSTLAVWGELPDDLRARLREKAKVECVAWQGAPDALRRDLETGKVAPPAPADAANPAGAPPDPVLEAARAAITRRDVDGVLVPAPGFRADLDGGRLGRLFLYFDWVRPDSKQARDRVRSEIDAWREEVVERREQERGLAAGFARAVDLSTRDVAPPERKSGEVLGTAVAFLLIVMSLLGGLYPSIDLTAGEKERGTMETLLCVPLHSLEIILGKFLTVWTISMVTGLANLGSMAATLSRALAGHGITLPGLSAADFLLIFLLYVPVSFITSACFLAVGVFAKDFKDGQNLVTPVYLLIALPAGLSMMPGIELGPATAFVPILNIALLVKALLVGDAKPDLAFLALLSSAAYGALALVLAARVFERVQVLLGGRESLRATLGLERRGGLPAPAFVVVFAAVMLVVLFYASLFLQRLGILTLLFVQQWGLILAPTLVCVAAFRFRWRDALALRRPPLLGLAAAIVIGASAWAVAAGILVRLLPPPDALVKQMEKVLFVGEDVPLWAILLAIAVSPGVCEETLFRGLILSGLRRLGKWPAVLLTALLFGLYHASLYRLLPTAWLGLLFGLVVWRTGSVFCGMAAHAVNNGLLALLSRSEGLARDLGVSGERPLPWGLTCAGIAVLAVGFLLLRAAPEAPPQSEPAT